MSKNTVIRVAISIALRGTLEHVLDKYLSVEDEK